MNLFRNILKIPEIHGYLEQLDEWSDTRFVKDLSYPFGAKLSTGRGKTEDGKEIEATDLQLDKWWVNRCNRGFCAN
jgi:hypothetical protein